MHRVLCFDHKPIFIQFMSLYCYWYVLNDSKMFSILLTSPPVQVNIVSCFIGSDKSPACYPPIHAVSQTIKACCDGIEWDWHSSIRIVDLWCIAQHVCDSLKRLSNQSYGVCCHCLQYQRPYLLIYIKHRRILCFIISITNNYGL